MQSLFAVYLELGFQHILDPRGYDHILFIVALCASYHPRQWKQLAILVTAFTIGHSLTLALATLQLISIPSIWVEFLIPLTIFGTALYNIWSGKQIAESNYRQRMRANYLLALGFGLIHGMGFSNFLRSALLPGEEDSLLAQLLAFNVGVELGQLCIVGLLLIIAYVVLEVGKAKQWDWNLFVSGLAAGPALIMMLERWHW